MKRIDLALWCSLLLLSGCASVGPDYERPELNVPDDWNQSVTKELESPSPDMRSWWTIFNDPTLDELIDTAVAGNLDLQTAFARI